MARRSGALDSLDIAALFIVVFALMYGGVQLSKGELLPEDRNDPREEQLRFALWSAINEDRAERGNVQLDPNKTDTSNAHGVQDVAERLAAVDYFDNATEGSPSTATTSRPNVLSGTVLCSQVPAKTTVTDPAWNDTDRDERVPNDVADGVARRLATLLLEGDGASVLYREDNYSNRIGLEIDGSEVYVVYRSCTIMND